MKFVIAIWVTVFMAAPVFSHPGHDKGNPSDIELTNNTAIAFIPRSEKRMDSIPAIVVERRFTVRPGDCKVSTRTSFYACTKNMILSNSLFHSGYEDSSLTVELDNHQIVTILPSGNGYQTALQRTGGTPEQNQIDIDDGITKLSAAQPLTLRAIGYRPATSAAEMELAPGSVLAHDDFVEETMIGRALAVSRNVLVSTAECLPHLSENQCEVSLLPRDHPDHPGSAFASEKVCRDHTFAEGDRVEACLGFGYRSYTITYYPAANISPLDVGKRIEQGIQQIQGMDPELYLHTFMLTPDNPDLPSKSDPRIIDSSLGVTQFVPRITLPMSYDHCAQAFDSSSHTCNVRGVSTQIPAAPTEMMHPLNYDARHVRFEDEGMVTFEFQIFLPNNFDNYTVRYLPGEAVLATPLDYVRRAFEILQSADEDHLDYYEIRNLH